MGIKEKLQLMATGTKACAATLLWGGVTGIVLTLASCARMGAPDGGWYDERPPRVVGAEPAENAVGVNSKKISIFFDEYIKLDNPSQKVMVSPPQHEMPEIKTSGRSIVVKLLDDLLPNTTYTIDFSDAISDNNEGNPMGNYTYTFSTGAAIDTMEVAGYVINASNMEPVKGILVGLRSADDDAASAGEKDGEGKKDAPFTRVSRTDSRGRFIIRGVAPGRYTVGAVMDADGDYAFSQRSEMMAFSHEVVVPSSAPDVKQDTIWADQNHIKDITLTRYTHFYPDNIVLRAFNHETTDRYFVKAERKEADRFSLFFTAPVMADGRKSVMPRLQLLSNDSEAELPFIAEPTEKGDTVTYWLRDTAMVNSDTLRIAMTTFITDTTGVQNLVTDTLELLAKTPYAKRMKALAEKEAKWKKDMAKKLKRAAEGEVIDTVMPKPALLPTYDAPQKMSPDGSVKITFPTPLARLDSTKVHLYVEQDSLWFRSPFVMQPARMTLYEPREELVTVGQGTVPARQYEVFTDWIAGARYSFEVDTLAFEDIHGNVNGRYKAGIEVNKEEQYASLFVNVSGAPEAPEGDAPYNIIVQMLNSADKPVAEAVVKDGTAEFYYIPQGKYYLRAIIDRNGNGVWDAGDYYADRQPEEVYYNPEEVECKAKWDITKSWNLTASPLYRQKPLAITKQKPEAEKKIKKRNADRAREKGIEVPEKWR